MKDDIVCKIELNKHELILVNLSLRSYNQSNA